MTRTALSALISLLLCAPAWAVPTSIPYRGMLTQADGSPYEGELSLQAALYPCEAEGCEAVWTSDEITLEVIAGQVNFMMEDSDGSLGDALNTDQGLWLQVSVWMDDSWMAMLPRQVVSSVPYAVVAHQADNAARLGGLDAADYLLATDTIPWSQLEAPPGTLDAVSCEPGEVAIASDEGWGCTPWIQSPGDDTLSGLSCVEGQVLAWIGGGWGCHTPEAIEGASYATTLYVDDAIAGLTNAYWTVDEVQAAIADATQNAASTLYVDDAIIGAMMDVPNLTEVNDAIAAATQNAASTLYVDDAIMGAMMDVPNTFQVDDAIAAATQNAASTLYVDDAIMGAMMDVPNTFQVDDAIAAATENAASTLYVDDAIAGAMMDVPNSFQVDDAIAAATENAASTLYVDDAIAAATQNLGGPRLLEHGYVGGACLSDTLTPGFNDPGYCSVEFLSLSLTGALLGEVVDIEVDVVTRHILAPPEDAEASSVRSRSDLDLYFNEPIVPGEVATQVLEVGELTNDFGNTRIDTGKVNQMVRFRVRREAGEPWPETVDVSLVAWSWCEGESGCYAEINAYKISITTF